MAKTPREKDVSTLTHDKVSRLNNPTAEMAGLYEQQEEMLGEDERAMPFSYEPPASYPLCKPCHSRLHKRFSADPGEWELFCLHLEAGGHGSEFVTLRGLAERRALCREIASGRKVALPRIREKESGPYWWRSLTLDPESLQAPWARPRPLRPRPDEAAFRRAFARAGLSKGDIAFLRAHADAPRRTATMRTLACEAMGKDDPKSANLRYGTLARRLTSLLAWEPDKREDGSSIWMSLIAEGWWPPGREYEWTMVPSAARAVRNMFGGGLDEESRPPLKKHAHIDAERGEEGMWTEKGFCLPFANDYLPITPELAGRVIDWQLRSEDWSGLFELESFSREGLALAKEVKAQLPDWRIIYWDHYKSHEARERGIKDSRYYEYEITLDEPGNDR